MCPGTSVLHGRQAAWPSEPARFKTSEVTCVTMCLCVVPGEESEGQKHSHAPAETALNLPVRLGSHPHSPAAISAFPTAARVPPEVNITGWVWGGADQMWHMFLKGGVPVMLL